MAISLLEQRSRPLAATWYPFGPFGTPPPSADTLPEEYDGGSKALAGRKLRRSPSWAGYTPAHLADLTPDVGSWPRAAAGQRQGQQSAAGPAPAAQEITTHMIRNLPVRLSRQAFMDMLDAYGFSKQYDYVHMPMNFMQRRNKCYAFVNFINEQAASRFADAFQASGESEMAETAWHVSPAYIQGKAANIAAATSKQKGRVRDKRFRPYIVCLDDYQYQ